MATQLSRHAPGHKQRFGSSLHPFWNGFRREELTYRPGGRMRLRSNRLYVIAAPLAVAAFLAGRATAGNGPRLFQAVFSIVARDAVDSLPTDRLYQLAARGLVESLGDPYAELQSRDEF